MPISRIKAKGFHRACLRTGALGLLAWGLLAPAAHAQARWNVTRSKDEMTGAARVRACANSLNTTSQGFPYNRGWTYATLCVIQDQDGTESMLVLNQGQLLCALGGSTFLLKVDEAQPVEHACVGTTSHRSDAGYFSDGDASVRAIASAQKMVRVQATLYNHGNVVFRFPPLGSSLQKEFLRSNGPAVDGR